MYRNRYCLVIDSALDVLQLVPEILERDRLTGFYGAVEDCLIADNSVSDEVLAQTEADSADLHINGCTIAGNTVGATSTIFAPGISTLYNSIIDQPGRTTVDPAVNDASAVAHVLANDISTLPHTVLNLAGTPNFIDLANGDYHLSPSSLGVDDAPLDPTLPALDLDGNRRLVDIPNGTDLFGPLDLGAYEMQITTVLSCANSDTIFCDGFEKLQ